MYYGETDHPRYKIFAEGFYHYPDYIFIHTDNPYI